VDNESQSKSKHLQDLTQGAVTGNLIRFAMPVLLSMFIQQSYGLADLNTGGRFSCALLHELTKGEVIYV